MAIPFVVLDLSYSIPLRWVSIQNFLDQIFAGFRNETWNQKVTVQDFLVELACVGVFERKVATCHGVQDDAAAPNVRVETLVSFTCDHFRSGIAWTATCSFEHFTLLIHVGEAKVDNLDIVLVIQK